MSFENLSFSHKMEAKFGKISLIISKSIPLQASILIIGSTILAHFFLDKPFLQYYYILLCSIFILFPITLLLNNMFPKAFRPKQKYFPQSEPLPETKSTHIPKRTPKPSSTADDNLKQHELREKRRLLAREI
jgi:hypothetical protein